MEHQTFIQREFVVKQVIKLAISSDNPLVGEVVDDLDLCSLLAEELSLRMEGVEDALYKGMTTSNLSIGTDVEMRNVHDVTDENVEDYL